MSEIRALGYVGFTATDLEAWKAFATTVIGLQLGEIEQDGTLVFRADNYQRRLIIHPGTNDDIAYVGWKVTDSESLDALKVRLQSLGIQIEVASKEDAKSRAVLELVRFADTEGLTQEVFYGATLRNDAPFKSPIGLPPFITGDQGLGHVVLSTTDYAAQTLFYHKTMDFKVSDYNDLKVGDFDGHLTFFRCNSRHHSLALGNFPLGRKFNHLMLEVASLDQVGFAYERAKEAGAHIFIELGRHTNDHVFSFYVLTPSGWPIEIGWGSNPVNDEAWHVTHHNKTSSWGHKVIFPPRND